MGLNGTKNLSKGTKWTKIGPNGIKNESKWDQMDQNGTKKEPRKDQMVQKGPKIDIILKMFNVKIHETFLRFFNRCEVV